MGYLIVVRHLSYFKYTIQYNSIIKKIIYYTITFLSVITCQAQNKQKTTKKLPNHYQALQNTLIISKEEIIKDINSIIDTSIHKEELIKSVANKVIIIGLQPDSCGNITDVLFNDLNFKAKSLIEDYFMLLKHINIFYRDENKELCMIDYIVIELYFDKYGKLFNLAL